MKTNNAESIHVYQSEICFSLKLVALYCACLFTISFMFNGSLMACLLSNKRLRSNPQNTFIMTLCTLNFVGTILELPQTIASSFACTWLFGRLGCISSGFVMFLIGSSTIFLLVAMSFERFYIVYDLMSQRVLKRSVYVAIIVACLGFGLFWSALPLLGWSYYSFEGLGTSCSIKWNERSLNVISYNVTILVFVFLVPLIILVPTSIKLILIVSHFI